MPAISDESHSRLSSHEGFYFLGLGARRKYFDYRYAMPKIDMGVHDPAIQKSLIAF